MNLKTANDEVYFELNNWIRGKYYPAEEPFLSWMSDEGIVNFLRDKEWLEKNEIISILSFIDMSINFCITAKREWVEEHCPKILTEFSAFLRFPEEDDEKPYGDFGCPFLSLKSDKPGMYFAELAKDSQGYVYYEVKKDWE